MCAWSFFRDRAEAYLLPCMVSAKHTRLSTSIGSGLVRPSTSRRLTQRVKFEFQDLNLSFRPGSGGIITGMPGLKKAPTAHSRGKDHIIRFNSETLDSLTSKDWPPHRHATVSELTSFESLQRAKAKVLASLVASCPGTPRHKVLCQRGCAREACRHHCGGMESSLIPMLTDAF